MKIADSIYLARSFRDAFQEDCLRIEIVGSNKRCDKPEAHDIELLLIPKPGSPRLEFGQKVIYKSFLEKKISDLFAANVLRNPSRKANGEKYKKFAIVTASQVNDFNLDLFIVNEKTWGIQNVIRTGPSIFSHRFVTNKSATCFDKETGRTYSGLLPDEYRYVAGETKIMRGTEVLELPEESDALALLGFGWIEPSKRREYINR